MVENIIIAVGPSRVRILSNSPRMVTELGGSLFTRAMLPGFQACEDDNGEVEHSVSILAGISPEFFCTASETRIGFQDATDEKQVYFETLFFLQTLFSTLLAERHAIYLVKAAAVFRRGEAHLLVGPPGCGKSTLLTAILRLDASAPYYDGKLLLDGSGRVLGGNAGLAPRHEGGQFPRKLRNQEGCVPSMLEVPAIVRRLVFPVVDRNANGRHYWEKYPEEKTVAKLFEAISYYANPGHNHLHRFGIPIPFLDNEARYRKRYSLARELAALPAWRHMGDAEAMADWFVCDG